MQTADFVESYHRDGFVVVPGVLPGATVDALRLEEKRLWAEAASNLDRPDVHWRRHETLGRVADRIDPVTPISKPFADLAATPRLSEIATACAGVPTVLFKEKLISKPPGTAGYGLHHDFAYWEHLRVPPEAFFTIFVALDDSNETSGAVEVFPGLHTKPLPRHPDDPFDIDPAAVQGCKSCSPTLAAGDVLVFHSLLPHRSGSNRSPEPRRAFIVTYVDARYQEQARPIDAERRNIVYRALARDNV